MSTIPLEDALEEIKRIAFSALHENPEINGVPVDTPAGEQFPGCSVKRLPTRLQQQAAEVSTRINPANAPLREFVAVGDLAPDSPLALTLTTAKYWGPAPRVLSVSFTESTPADLRARIVSHLNAWSLWTSISFAETAGSGDVRISRDGGGHWSYLGTDSTLIPRNRPTMSLQSFTMTTPESEFRRVVRHEAGHTLGFPHEHMRRELVQRIDPAKAYPYFLATQGWSTAMVDQQVLTPLDDATIYGTTPDQDSIMCYQLPGAITYDGQPIRGGTDINAVDYAMAAVIYPKPLFPPHGGSVEITADWDPADDVSLPA